MADNSVLQAVEELLTTETPEERLDLYHRYPVLLTAESVATLNGLAGTGTNVNAATTSQGKWSIVAFALEGLQDAHRTARNLAHADWLAGVGEIVAHVSAGQNDPEPKPLAAEESEPPAPPARWMGEVRRLLALNDTELLQRAVEVAREEGQTEIPEFLTLFGAKQVEQLRVQIKSRLPNLDVRSDLPEIGTLALLELHLRAQIILTAEQADEGERSSIIEQGLEACETAAEIAHELGDTFCGARYLLWTGIGLALSEEPEEAERYLWVALFAWRTRLAQAIEGERGQLQVVAGETAHRLAILLLGQGRLLAADVYLEEAQAHYATLTEEGSEQAVRELLETTAIRVQIHRRLGNVERVLATLETALPALRELANLAPLLYAAPLGQMLSNQAIAARTLKRYPLAVESYREALAIFRSLVTVRPSEHEPALAFVLSNYGNLLVDLREYVQAERVHREALAIHRRLAGLNPRLYQRELGTTLTNLGSFLWLMERLEEAEALLQEAVLTLEKCSSPDEIDHQVSLAAAYYNYAVTLRKLRRPAASIEPFRRALAIRWRLETIQPERFGHPVAFTLTSLGNAYQETGEIEAAIVYHEEAVQRYKALAENQKEQFELPFAQALNNLANALADVGDYTKAERGYREVLAIRRRWFKKYPDIYASELSRVLVNLGHLDEEQGKLVTAESYYQEAIKVPGEDDTEALRVAWGHLGHLLLDLGESRTLEAYEALAQAVAQIERLRGEMLTLERREAVMRENVAIYDALLVAAVRVGKIHEALVAAEQGKSRAINDLLTLRDAGPRNAPVELAQEYRQLLIKLRGDEAMEHCNPEMIECNDSLEERTQQETISVRQKSILRLRECAQAIEKFDPVVQPAAVPLTKEEIFALAANTNSILVLFRITDWGSFTFLVFPDGSLDLVNAPEFTRQRLAELLFGTREVTTGGWLTPDLASSGDYRIIDETLRLVDEELLMSIRERLVAAENAEDRLRSPSQPSLVLIPNRGLALLPLHACWRKSNTGRHFLLDDYTIRYAPSLAILANCTKKEAIRPNPATILVIANPSSTSDLPYVEWECQQIVKAWQPQQCEVLLGESATLDALDARVSEASILHFACHGCYKPDHPLSSHLQLAADELYTLGGILEKLRLPSAWLVALSACETSRVDPLEIADEHYGLSIGFLIAGAPTVYATLWAVDDLATALIMSRVHTQLVRGLPKAAALQESQIWLRDATLHQLESFIAATGSLKLQEKIERLREVYEPEDRPYSHPYWWAALQTVGS